MEASIEEIEERVSKMTDEEIQDAIDNYPELRKTEEGYHTGQLAGVERLKRLENKQ